MDDLFRTLPISFVARSDCSKNSQTERLDEDFARQGRLALTILALSFLLTLAIVLMILAG